ncbi:hypothetical protein GCM10010207_79840 [Streptomyces atratus]|nr:hypothetical protein GCM10010207_79840 [Streptomyces atratus]
MPVGFGLLWVVGDSRLEPLVQGARSGRVVPGCSVTITGGTGRVTPSGGRLRPVAWRKSAGGS